MDARPRGRDPAHLSRARHRLRRLLAARAAASSRGRFNSPEELDPGDFRRNGPRFTGEALEHNLTLAAKVREIADEKDCAPGQLALAWVLAQGDDLVPIPGTKRRAYLEENLGALDVELSDDDLARIDAELPAAAGDRYDAASMATVNR